MTDESLPTQVVKVGNPTDDPTLAYSKAGLAYLKGGLAWQPYDPQTKQRGETVFYDITAFGEMAEHACESLTKGMRVIAVGRPELYTPEPSESNPEPTPRRQIVLTAIGPDLRWATAKVDKITRSGSTSKPASAAADEEPF